MGTEGTLKKSKYSQHIFIVTKLIKLSGLIVISKLNN